MAEISKAQPVRRRTGTSSLCAEGETNQVATDNAACLPRRQVEALRCVGDPRAADGTDRAPEDQNVDARIAPASGRISGQAQDGLGLSPRLHPRHAARFEFTDELVRHVLIKSRPGARCIALIASLSPVMISGEQSPYRVLNVVPDPDGARRSVNRATGVRPRPDRRAASISDGGSAAGTSGSSLRPPLQRGSAGSCDPSSTARAIDR